MDGKYQRIREQLEADGFKMNDKEFSEAVDYARRKAAVAGKDENYMPYLLPDVIREMFLMDAINTATFSMMEAEKYLLRRINDGTTATDNNNGLFKQNPGSTYETNCGQNGGNAGRF